MATNSNATAFQCGTECNKNEAANTSSRIKIPTSLKRMAGLAGGITATTLGIYSVAKEGNPDGLRWAGVYAYFSGAICAYLSIEGTKLEKTLEKKFKAALSNAPKEILRMVKRFQEAHRPTFTVQRGDGNGNMKILHQEKPSVLRALGTALKTR